MMKKLSVFMMIVFLISAVVVFAAEKHGTHAKQHGHMHGHMHGADGTGHDEYTMPGLRGENATSAESEEIGLLFRKFEKISREVENLENGIKTTTNSSDPEVLPALISHVVGMLQRVSENDDPKIMIQSPTLDVFFLKGDQINTDFEITDQGIIVVQTSNDPELVTALQTHAAEVTAMVDRGMEAVHEMMQERGGNMH